MNFLKPPLLAVVAIALSTQFSQAQWLTKTDFKPLEGGNLELHIANPDGHSANDQRPVIIFFFGGGWKFGKPGQFYPFIQELSKEGIVAISAQYRT
ncbi:hypothetical protein SH580_17245 [Coraliomargarita algicola]|uniref:Alpha/beta hydrolase n=1 Tax=Coraliomargarita algicola TaxID=3092156 RepID=A0ABZ0RJL7_9BACT|nr:hypothetical protein [Coraliomargarita sp. J2-16]WPJ95170.1 hypothetical protein SH580_17245 [Coraliomargarita sp. J2-16]